MRNTKEYVAIFLLLFPLAVGAEEQSDLGGLWESYKRFGPDVHGPVLIDEN